MFLCQRYGNCLPSIRPDLSRPFLSFPQSPKAVLGNRFIVVELSEVNLVDVDPHSRSRYQDAGEIAAAEEAAGAKAAATAAQAARKKEHEKVMVS